MENWSKWKFIKVGFWLGIGFIIPQLVVLSSGTILSIVAVPPMVEKSMEGAEGVMSDFTSDYDVIEQIKIEKYRQESRGNKLFILGAIKNVGNKKASSIQLEAELLNQEGEFVFECSEYISRSLQPQDVENFQITCGCGKNPIPAFSDISLRVVNASTF